ncbi:MAG: ABC transporter permease [Bacteroidales bacterium]|nr:ABC transporter permease [Bacteroidales bacterium]
MKSPLYQLTLIHFREFYREPAIIFWAIVFPILMAWGLGIAFTKQGTTVQYVALTENNNKQLQDYLNKADILVNKAGQKEYIAKYTTKDLAEMEFRLIKCNRSEAQHLLKIGKISIILEARPDKIEYQLDKHSPEAKFTYLMLNAAINNIEFSGLTGEIKPLSAIGTRYIDFFVPGLIAMGIMSSLMWGISYGLIEKRNKKLIRRFIATPMRKSDFLLSHFIARFFLCFVETIILYLFAKAYFNTTITGSISALVLIILAGNLTFSGIAILIASRTSNTEIGNGLINAVQMPMMLLSGIFFSYHNFPDWAVSVIKFLPLTMLADGIRSIFNEGASLVDVWMPIVSLSAIGSVFFIIGLKIYKWY